MEYDTGCLVVWPEWSASFPIWHPQTRANLPGPVRMANPEEVRLPPGLAAEFERWIEWFDEAMPGSMSSLTFDWEPFNKEGERLTAALAKVVGDRYVVLYCAESAA